MATDIWMVGDAVNSTEKRAMDAAILCMQRRARAQKIRLFGRIDVIEKKKLFEGRWSVIVRQQGAEKH